MELPGLASGLVAPKFVGIALGRHGIGPSPTLYSSDTQFEAVRGLTRACDHAHSAKGKIEGGAGARTAPSYCARGKVASTLKPCVGGAFGVGIVSAGVPSCSLLLDACLLLAIFLSFFSKSPT